MPSPARKLEEHKDRLDDLAAGNIDAEQYEDVNKVSDPIRDKIDKAEGKGVLNMQMANLYRNRLTSSKDDREAEKIGAEIDVVINFIRKLRGHKGIDKKTVVDNEIAKFMESSPDKRRQYEQGLAEHLADLDDLYKRILAVSPKEVEDFRQLIRGKTEFVVQREKEHAEQKNELERQMDNHGDIFSADDKKKTLATFDELRDPSAKEKFVQAFEKDIQTRRNFRKFPKEMQKANEREFEKSGRAEKRLMVQNMERKMEADARDILANDKNAQHFSQIEKESAIKLFKSKPIDQRTEMYDVLRGMLKYNAEKISPKYEKLPASVKLEIQERKGKNFYDLSFEDKELVIDIGKRLSESGETLKKDYKEELDAAVKAEYMSPDSAKLFMAEFDQQDSYGKAEWLATFRSTQLKPRVEVTENYRRAVRREHPRDKARRDELLSAFYKQGLTGRTALWIEISLKQVDMKGKETAPANDNATPDKVATETEGEGTKDNVVSLNEFKAKLAVDRAKQSGTIKEKIKVETVKKELADLKEASDRSQSNQIDGRKKDQHLPTQTRRETNKDLVAHTEGKMTIGDDGKAQKVDRVVIKKVGERKDDMFNLTRKIVQQRNRRDKRYNHLNLVAEDGKLIEGRKAIEDAAKSKDELRKDLAEKTVQNLKANGKKLSKEDEKLIRRRTEVDKLQVDLNETI